GHIINEDFFKFIAENEKGDIARLLLKYSDKELGFDLRFAISQIALRQKTSRKLPSFISHSRFIFPDSVSAEMASDEKVASFHASIVGKGKKVTDLTAGLGIDAFSICFAGNTLTAVELDKGKAEALEYNAFAMEASCLKVINSNCIDYISSLDFSDFPDIFFIDPARRNSTNRRAYSFKDCLPDITAFYKTLVRGYSKLMIKASPLLDITSIEKDFEGIEAIYIIGVKGEVKEVLIVIGGNESILHNIHAIDIMGDGEYNEFTISSLRSEYTVGIATHLELKEGLFLYEPNAMVMKLHASHEISEQFKDIKKVSPNSELYISEKMYEGFPGRIIKIDNVLSSKELKKIKNKGYSIVVRNYPETSESLKTKLRVSENDSRFIYAFRIGKDEKPIVISGTRIV
ncbi:MAG: hypothetical protein K2J70_00780, partial [Muribaculaceae bacterium]|nr:hypothetical protein [Muribaculaceae bacterium]